MRNLLKWQIAELEAIKKMSNEELLDNTIWASGGDDYDGCFTKRGEWIFGELQVELQIRLIEIGFWGKE